MPKSGVLNAFKRQKMVLNFYEMDPSFQMLVARILDDYCT